MIVVHLHIEVNFENIAKVVFLDEMDNSLFLTLKLSQKTKIKTEIEIRTEDASVVEEHIYSGDEAIKRA